VKRTTIKRDARAHASGEEEEHFLAMVALKHAFPLALRFRVRSWTNRFGHFRRARLPIVVRAPLAAATTAWLERRTARVGKHGLARIDAIFVINLAKRADRLAGFSHEMRRLALAGVRRVEGVRHERPSVGCARSHLACLEEMVAHGYASAMICEDDARFLAGRAELDVLVDRFLDDDDAEVACFAYNQFRVRPHDALFLRATDTQTTACYVVKASIAPALAAAWQHAAREATADADAGASTLDIAWKQLQKERTFVIPVRRAARQEHGFSDIEQRVVRYGV
jgi:glycosyl transferase family 25